MRHLFNKVICLIALSFVFLSIANADNTECPVLFYAVVTNERELAQHYLDYGIDPNRSLENCDLESNGFPEGSTLLSIAIRLDNVFMIALLRDKINWNIVDASGNTSNDLYIPHLCKVHIVRKRRGREVNECIRKLRNPEESVMGSFLSLF